MKKIFVFVVLTLVVTAGIFAFTPTTAAPAPNDEPIRVWVEFQPGRKSAVQAALKGNGAQFHFTFDELNAFVVTLPASALTGISRNPNVVSIEEDVPRYFITPKPMSVTEPGDPYTEELIPYGIDAVQARDVWDVNRDDMPDPGAPTGQGIKVCIIDSGFYADHEDLDQNQLTGGISQVGSSYDTDGFGHGSHVAGTISAMLNGVGVVGVTPGTVEFHIVKIFDDAGLWTNSSDLTAAIYECRDNGANIINMSLGGGSSSRKEQRAFDSVYASGVLMIAAAGNDNVSDPHYPSAYSSVVSVAAVDSDNVKADFSNYGEYTELAAPGVDIWSTLPYIATNSLTVNGVVYAANHIEFAALGSVNGTLINGGLCGATNLAWAGYVVICERGDFSFADKVTNVEDSGGIGVVIYNNEPGNFLGTMDTESSNIIALSISQEDGQYLVTNELGSNGELFAQIEQPASGYEAWGGTSMASPHVAGVAALVWSYDPSLTNVEIREALNESAYDIGGDGWDPYFGNGLVQALDALTHLGYTGGGPVNEAPSVTISSPTDGATFDSGTTITFIGSASDPEDGSLNSAIQWSSNLDGNLGTGESISVGLSDGNHTITASVTDSGGKTGTTSVNISVKNPQEPGTMHVSAIDMSYTRFRRNYTISTVVTIVDEIGAPVLGATIYLSTNTATGSIITGSDGTAKFSVTSRSGGTYTSTVTNVIHGELIYNSTANIETSETLIVP